MRGLVSTRRHRTGCLKRSTRPKATAWAWVYPSAARLLKLIMGVCGLPRMMGQEPRSHFLFLAITRAHPQFRPPAPISQLEVLPWLVRMEPAPNTKVQWKSRFEWRTLSGMDKVIDEMKPARLSRIFHVR